MPIKYTKKSQRGFSLVELMITVAIIGIIAAIAIPVYKNYVSAARHNKAKAMLMQLPVLLEQYRAESLTGVLCPPTDAPCSGNSYIQKTGTYEISAADYLSSFDPVLSDSGVNYEYRISFTSNDEADLKIILTGSASDNVTCTFPQGCGEED